MHPRFLVVGFGLIAACSQDVVLKEQNNVAPAVVIQAPEDLSTFTEVETIDFRAQVEDANGIADVTGVLWTSNLDGELGIPADTAPDGQGQSRLATQLSLGTHTITVQATDADGMIGTDSISVTIEAAAQIPLVEINSPTNFQAFDIGETVQMFGSASDPNQAPDTLNATWTVEDGNTGAVVYTTSGNPSATGVTTADFVDAPFGDYRIELAVVDDDANESTAEVFIRVEDPSLRDDDGDGWTTAQGDCDDNDPDRAPDLPEQCDLIDNDCNGIVDDKDLDLDNHIDENCGAYSGNLPLDDCDDAEDTVYFGAPELEDGLDNDCNGDIDDGTPSYDQDGDCYCPGTTCIESSNPACTTLGTNDCNDADPSVSPADADGDGASGCDGDCNDADPAANIDDADGDGFSTCAMDCDDSDASLTPADLDGDGYSTCDGDCDDDTLQCGADCFPGNGAADICDGFDQDCDATLDEDPDRTWYYDGDGDGYTVNTNNQIACDDPDGAGNQYVGRATTEDCDDTNAALTPEDSDGDGYSTCTQDCDDSDATLTPLDADGDGYSTCTADCDDSNALANPGLSDEPDPTFLDSNCDGFDGDLSMAVFVDLGTGSDRNTGGINDPFENIQTGIAAATSGEYVIVSGDLSYNLAGGTLTLRDGVSVYGGYSASNGWSRSAALVEVQAGTTGLFAENVNSNTVVAQLNVVAAGATTAGESSYGGRLNNSSGLIFRNSRVAAGDGAPGNAGSDGSVGSPGSRGSNGDNGGDGSSCCGYGGSAGGGCNSGGSGGRGGPDSDNGEPGIAGNGPAGGARGSGGSGRDSDWCITGCSKAGSGGAGGSGGDGAAGADGTGGASFGAVGSLQYVVSNGSAGRNGTCGSGGGGGGGGGGTDCCQNDRGAGGGGGGGGAYGGTYGTGGVGGGGSFGLLLVDSFVTLDGVTLRAGNGGRGGDGGSGGLGGLGGDGGTRGTGLDDGGHGGAGGAGGDGGRGGHGGGGGGGPSYCLYKSNSVKSIGPGGVTFVTGTGGAGGASDASGRQGQTGVSGQEF